MAVRGWGGAVAAAIGTGAAVGAAQLGVGYGLDVISFAPDSSGRLSTEGWVTSLTWATWIAATSTIAGAIVADRLSTRPTAAAHPAESAHPTETAHPYAAAHPADQSPGGPAERTDRVTTLLWRLVLATAAALGASATVALVAVPARVAELDDVSSPQTVAAGYAALGVVTSLLVALAALAARAVAANLLATAAWLWLVAVITVTGGVLSGRDRARVPLGFWDVTADGPWFRSVLLADTGPALAAALLIGLLAALPAARRGDRPVGLVGSGAAGPLVLAIAYLLTQPDLIGAGAVDLSRHLVVPYLVLAGLLGSLLAGVVRSRSDLPATAAPVAAPVPAPRSEPLGAGADAGASTGAGSGG